jgi:hypothetical protein
MHRASGMPGMGLIEGQTGYGKTTAAAWLVVRLNAVFVRALATTTPSSLLESICKELGIGKRSSNVQTVEDIVAKLAETGRPLFIDEADYLVGKHRLIETVRDIHDLATVPVILIGMHGFRRKITHLLQLTGRIAEWVEFSPSTVLPPAVSMEGFSVAGSVVPVVAVPRLASHLGSAMSKGAGWVMDDVNEGRCHPGGFWHARWLAGWLAAGSWGCCERELDLVKRPEEGDERVSVSGFLVNIPVAYLPTRQKVLENARLLICRPIRPWRNRGLQAFANVTSLPRRGHGLAECLVAA